MRKEVSLELRHYLHRRHGVSPDARLQNASIVKMLGADIIRALKKRPEGMTVDEIAQALGFSEYGSDITVDNSGVWAVEGALMSLSDERRIRGTYSIEKILLSEEDGIAVFRYRLHARGKQVPRTEVAAPKPRKSI